MLHVKEIREIIDAGKNDEAHDALGLLLQFGPSNIEALKLRAQLFAFEGRFGAEAEVWDRIGTLDREDTDAVAYFLRKQLEDREHFYFTDDIAGGGRRFMAYPRGLVNAAAMGLVGCFAFLLTSRMTPRFPVLGEAPVMLSLFCLFVMVPWVAILWSWLRGVKAVVVDNQGITVATRLKRHVLRWSDIGRVALAREMSAKGYPRLTLVMIPKVDASQVLEVDLNHDSTAIRARSHLIREITRLHKEPEYAQRGTLGLDGRSVATF
jgi:hypothetical protein